MITPENKHVEQLEKTVGMILNKYIEDNRLLKSSDNFSAI